MVWPREQSYNQKDLSCYVNDDHDNWDEILAEVVFAYSNSEHSSTGFKDW